MAHGPLQQSYERKAITHMDASELDFDAVEEYVRQRAPSLLDVASPEEAAARLGLLAKAGPRFCPTPIGLLLFGHHPQLLHPQWGVVAVRIDGLALSDDVKVRLDLEGSIQTLLDEAVGFVRDHAHHVADQVAPGQTAPEYPETAVREIIVNALLHRDLRVTGRVAVRLFDDRLEVWSPGGPPSSSIDLQQLSDEGGASLPRNVLLASHARAMGIGEQVGRGLAVARRSLAERTHQTLQITTDGDSVCVTLPSGWQATTAGQALS